MKPLDGFPMFNPYIDVSFFFFFPCNFQETDIQFSNLNRKVGFALIRECIESN